MSDKFKIKLASEKLPVSFVAFDILYKDNKQLTDLNLIERKQILKDTLIENERISISRYIENDGIKLFELTTKNELEGIVAKKKDSNYYFDKRTKDWIKIKNNDNTTWIEPNLICTVKYMEKTDSGSLRQPVFKGIRNKWDIS